jgi:hypothetical protein
MVRGVYTKGKEYNPITFQKKSLVVEVAMLIRGGSPCLFIKQTKGRHAMLFPEIIKSRISIPIPANNNPQNNFHNRNPSVTGGDWSSAYGRTRGSVKNKSWRDKIFFLTYP